MASNSLDLYEIYDTNGNLVYITKNNPETEDFTGADGKPVYKTIVNEITGSRQHTYLVYDYKPQNCIIRNIITTTNNKPFGLEERFDNNNLQYWEDQKDSRFNRSNRTIQLAYSEVPKNAVVLGDSIKYDELNEIRKNYSKILYGGKYYPVNKQLHKAIVVLNKSQFYKKQFVSYISSAMGWMPKQIINTIDIPELSISRYWRQYLVDVLNKAATFNNNENRREGLFFLPPVGEKFVTFPHIWLNISESNDVIPTDEIAYNIGRFVIAGKYYEANGSPPPSVGSLTEWRKENLLDKRIPFLSTPKIGIGRGRLPPGWSVRFNYDLRNEYTFEGRTTLDQPQLIYNNQNVVVEAENIPIEVSATLNIPIASGVVEPVALPVDQSTEIGGRKSLRRKSTHRKFTRRKSQRKKSTRRERRKIGSRKR